jgi:hypothetical protein
MGGWLTLLLLSDLESHWEAVMGLHSPLWWGWLAHCLVQSWPLSMKHHQWVGVDAKPGLELVLRVCGING